MGKTTNEDCGAISLTVVETQGTLGTNKVELEYLRLPFRD